MSLTFDDVVRIVSDLPGIEVGTLLGQYTPGIGLAFGAELSLHAVRGDWQAWVNYSGGRSLNRAPALGERSFRRIRLREAARGQVRNRLGVEITTYEDCLGMARGEVADQRGGQFARRRMAAERAGIELQDVHRGAPEAGNRPTGPR